MYVSDGTLTIPARVALDAHSSSIRARPRALPRRRVGDTDNQVGHELEHRELRGREAGRDGFRAARETRQRGRATDEEHRAEQECAAIQRRACEVLDAGCVRAVKVLRGARASAARARGKPLPRRRQCVTTGTGESG